eukprot:scaffold6685_cov202-Prasinococcus_capsulatus_cf.AAC.3
MALRQALAKFASPAFRLAPTALPPPSSAAPLASIFSRTFATVLPDLKYAKSHEYVKVEGDIATIGISDFAQTELGDVVFVELPEEGTEFAKAESFGMLASPATRVDRRALVPPRTRSRCVRVRAGVAESVKAASDVYIPVSGTVTEANAALADNPSLLNSSPYEEGWMIKVKMSNPAELEELLDSAAYTAHIEVHTALALPVGSGAVRAPGPA